MNKFGSILRVRNVNEALPLALGALKNEGNEAVSRGMKTLRMPGPFMTVYANPTERVLFCKVRDANPFFHLMESLWIIAGSNKLALPKHFLARYADFSDDGVTLHGAYGHRLRHQHGFDQIERACHMLAEKPDTRQVVLSIWDPVKDMLTNTKDMPCNDMIMLDIVDNKLNMTVCNRSNDAIWGAYGANVVQFSMLQEFIALRIGIKPGRYVQQSNNFHVYLDNPFWQNFLRGEYEHGHVHNLYSLGDAHPVSLAVGPMDTTDLHEDCKRLDEFVNFGSPPHLMRHDSSFFDLIVMPAMNAYQKYKDREWDEAHEALLTMPTNCDWQHAMVDWLLRRQEKAA